MALLNCPECNNQISDQADVCPHCGYILKKIESEVGATKKYKISGNDAKFKTGSLISIIGYIILQIGTFLYSWGKSWLRTFMQYSVSSGYSRYSSKMSTGSTIMGLGAIVFIVGFVLCVLAFRRGDISQKTYNFKWGRFAIALEVISFVVVFALVYILYEAWFNVLLFETTAVICVAITIADLVFHKGEKRTSSIVALAIGGIIIFLSIL